MDNQDTKPAIDWHEHLGLAGKCTNEVMLMMPGRFTGLRDDLLHEHMVVLERAARKFKPELGFAFSTYAIAAMKRPHQMRRIIAAVENRKPWRRVDEPRWLISMDQCGIDRGPIYGIVDSGAESPDGRAEQKDTVEMIMDAVSVLSDREQYVFDRYINGPATLRQCGIELGLTRERVRQISDKIKKRIKHSVSLLGNAHLYTENYPSAG